MKYEIVNVLPDFGTNTYLVYDEISKDALYIDPAAPDARLLELLQSLELNLKLIINTHGHGDHIAGNYLLKNELDVPLYIHKADADMLTTPSMNLSLLWGHNVSSPPADHFLDDGDEIKLGAEKLQVIHTPGHTQGCICIYGGGLLISGDTLFAQGVGRTDLPGGSQQQLLDSINHRLFTLPEETVVLPGHGPRTTIGDEKLINPFL